LFGPGSIPAPDGSGHHHHHDDPFTTSEGSVDLDDHTVGLMSKPTSFSTNTGARVTIASEDKKEEKKYSFYQIQYYQEFFNVDSSDVAIRCARSMWPFKNDFLDTVKHNPDFYGPFWVTTTLIFMMAASGNFAAYLGVDAGAWHYDIMKLIYGAAVIYGYCLLIPVALYFYLRWIEVEVRLIEILCIYGYSLFIYLPVAIISIAPVTYVKWIVAGVGMILSTGFLVVNLWMPLKSRMAHAIIILIVLTALHGGLALTFRLYFFCYNAIGDPNITC